jgi:benzoyl-CoA reductase/2-hydroxyglutaryl-CoA dehydratase subunit BcrC/BadD/HgdB
MNIIEKSVEIARSTDNSWLVQARNNGRRIIGHFCSYVPMELIHAAGCVPYKMRAVGSTGTDMGDLYYAPLNCSFVRHCMNKVLKGDFSFLDGVVFMNGCDHTRRLYDNWRYSGSKPEFLHMLFVPHVVGSNALDVYKANIHALKESLEKYFHVAITDEKLQESIKLYNDMRRLLKSIDIRRKERKVPIKGSEMLGLVMAVSAVPVETAIDMLREAAADLDERKAGQGDDVRLLALAGCVEEIDHVKLYEDAGGAIVADSFCFGSRYYGKLIDESDRPIDALAKGYLDLEPSCPRMMDDYPRRVEQIQALVREYSIDAIVVEKLKFCDMWGWEIERLRRESKKKAVPPVLAIEREYNGGATGQIKTRIQAFYEQIRNSMEVDYKIERSNRTDYYVR